MVVPIHTSFQQETSPSEDAAAWSTEKNTDLMWTQHGRVGYPSNINNAVSGGNQAADRFCGRS